MRRIQVSITIEPELWEKLKERARSEGRSASNMVERVLRDALEPREPPGEDGTSAGEKVCR